MYLEQERDLFVQMPQEHIPAMEVSYGMGAYVL